MKIIKRPYIELAITNIDFDSFDEHTKHNIL